MKTHTSKTNDDALDQLGGTDKIEQAAADIAVENGRSCVTNKDRDEALKQMNKTAPPAKSGPPSPETGKTKKS